MQVNIGVLLAGLLGAVPFLLIARRYGNKLPVAMYIVMVLGTATVLGYPHDFRTGTAMHGFIALIGTGFLWFTYNGQKQIESVRQTLQDQGMVRVRD